MAEARAEQAAATGTVRAADADAEAARISGLEASLARAEASATTAKAAAVDAASSGSKDTSELTQEVRKLKAGSDAPILHILIFRQVY